MASEATSRGGEAPERGEFALSISSGRIRCAPEEDDLFDGSFEVLPSTFFSSPRVGLVRMILSPD